MASVSAVGSSSSASNRRCSRKSCLISSGVAALLALVSGITVWQWAEIRSGPQCSRNCKVVVYGELSEAVAIATHVDEFLSAYGINHKKVPIEYVNSKRRGSGAHDLSLVKEKGILFVFDNNEGCLSMHQLNGTASGLTLTQLGDEVCDLDRNPFTGVSAANGRVVVSGGTKKLNVFSYRNSGGGNAVLSASPLHTVDLGQGQPDVLLDPTRPVAYVSTHFEGTEFGVTVLDLSSFAVLATARIPNGAFGPAFSDTGITRPSNFPLDFALWERPSHNQTALVAAHIKGLTVFDVTSPIDGVPVLTPLIEVLADAGTDRLIPISVAVSGDTAYVVGSQPSPAGAVIDLVGQVKIGSFALSSRPVSVATDGVSGGTIATACDVPYAGHQEAQLRETAVFLSFQPRSST